MQKRGFGVLHKQVLDSINAQTDLCISNQDSMNRHTLGWEKCLLHSYGLHFYLLLVQVNDQKTTSQWNVLGKAWLTCVLWICVLVEYTIKQMVSNNKKHLWIFFWEKINEQQGGRILTVHMEFLYYCSCFYVFYLSSQDKFYLMDKT